MSGTATGSDSGNEGYLSQTFSICKNGTYTISFDLDQVPNTTSTSGGAPFVEVYMYAPPPNNASPDQLAEFSFGGTYFNSTVYYAHPFHQDVKNAAGKWTSFSFPYPLYVGNWKLSFQLFTVASKGKSGTKIRIDNVVVKSGS